VFNISNVLWKHNDLHKRNIEAVLEKELLVVQAYTVAYPVAVVVHLHAATVAHLAVVSSRGLQRLPLTFIARSEKKTRVQ
jgi:hypothetical protein